MPDTSQFHLLFFVLHHGKRKYFLFLPQTENNDDLNLDSIYLFFLMYYKPNNELIIQENNWEMNQ